MWVRGSASPLPPSHGRNPDKWKCQLCESHRRCPTNLKLSGNLAYNRSPVFISDTLLSIFNEGSRRGHKWWISLVGRRDERASWWGGEGKKERETSHRFLSLSPMNVAPVRRRTSTKELYIADKWRGLRRFFLVLPLSEEAWGLQGKSATAAAALDPLEKTGDGDRIYEESNVWWMCSWV